MSLRGVTTLVITHRGRNPPPLHVFKSRVFVVVLLWKACNLKLIFLQTSLMTVDFFRTPCFLVDTCHISSNFETSSSKNCFGGLPGENRTWRRTARRPTGPFRRTHRTGVQNTSSASSPEWPGGPPDRPANGPVPPDLPSDWRPI
jgi:hypothetical protein